MTRESAQAAPRRRREVTRPLLLSGALRAIARHGWDGASVEIICTESGFTRGAFYSNFTSKDDLGLTLYRGRAAHVIEMIRTHSSSTGSSQDFAAALLATMTEPDEFIFKTGFELAALGDAGLLQAVQDVEREVVAEVAAALAHSPGLSADQNAAFSRPAAALVAVFRGLAARALLQPGTAPTTDEVHDLIAAVLSVYSKPVERLGHVS
jgi:AcrR family transcriptional regulator